MTEGLYLKNKTKYLIAALLFAITILLLVTTFNYRVSYYQGINYRVRIVKIPLYVKIIDFISRDYHYKETLKGIISGLEPEEEKVFKLFRWSHENIRPIPANFPVIDDHVWHIIIRGYGASDQVSDVFTTLCNYAKVEAFFTWVRSKGGEKKIPLSFIKIKDKWFVFDPYYGIYFGDNKGSPIDIGTIKSGAYLIVGEDRGRFDYSDYIPNLPTIKEMGLARSNIQSPVNRLIFQVRKWGKRNEK